MKRRGFLGFLLGTPAAIAASTGPSKPMMSRTMEAGKELDELLAEKFMGWKRDGYNAHMGYAYWRDEKAKEQYIFEPHCRLESVEQIEQEISRRGFSCRKTIAPDKVEVEVVSSGGKVIAVGIANNSNRAVCLAALNLMAAEGKI